VIMEAVTCLPGAVGRKGDGRHHRRDHGRKNLIAEVDALRQLVRSRGRKVHWYVRERLRAEIDVCIGAVKPACEKHDQTRKEPHFARVSRCPTQRGRFSCEHARCNCAAIRWRMFCSWRVVICTDPSERMECCLITLSLRIRRLLVSRTAVRLLRLGINTSRRSRVAGTFW
jgi:hypothetical protein